MEVSANENGFLWEIGAAAPAGLSQEVLAKFPDLVDLPGVATLKHNHFRSVFRIPLPGIGAGAGGAGGVGVGEGQPSSGAPAEPVGACSVIAKVYRYTKAWDRLRFRFLPTRARQEWSALTRFGQLGLPTAVPLAVAQWRRAGRLWGGGLVLSYLDGTVTVNEHLHSLHTAAGELDSVPPQAEEVLGRIGRLLKQLHEQGVWHRDLHGGNFLVAPESGSVFLIDLHTCVFLGRLARWQRHQGLVKLMHSLLFSVPRAWLRPLFDAYGDISASEEESLLRSVNGLERTRIRSRSKRCFVPSSRYDVQKSRGLRQYRLRLWEGEALAPAELEKLYSTPAKPEFVKRGACGWVARRELSSGNRFCVKHRRYGLRESLQSLLESHRLRRAYAAGHALWVHGVASPRVVALRERTVLGMVREAYLVTEWIDDAEPLDRRLMDTYFGRRPAHGDDARRKHGLARRVGRYLRRLHDTGVYPHDLSPQNVLVQVQAFAMNGAEEKPDDVGGLFVVDLDHVYLWQRLSRRGRLKNLVQMGNLCEGHISTYDRLRALKAYSGVRAEEGGEGKYWNAAWIQSLRAGLLREHAHVLNGLLRSERTRWAGVSKAGAPKDEGAGDKSPA